MVNKKIINNLSRYVDSLHPIIYINHFDFNLVDELISALYKDAKIVEYNNANGLVDFSNKSSLLDCDLTKFLGFVKDYGYKEKHTLIVLKDVHGDLDNPKIIALLKDIAERNLYTEGYNATIFIVSSVLNLPKELESYITIFDIPLPSYEEIEELIREFVGNERVEESLIGEFARSFKGLNEFQIRQVLYLAYLDEGILDKEDKLLVLREKEQFIKKSGILELIRSSENMTSIGGLNNLKEWLERKNRIFANLDKAIKYGVDVPKGILIVGMPGCGKSLTAKATASLFQIPLVRLDVGRLLGKYVGESEKNMRQALSLSEAISPCVLWIDEIEKSFAGAGNEGSNDVTKRLFGQFLTWMQEKDNSVFIVATANDVSGMPLEFLRKGRFDELFFVDLPNEKEREDIFKIHFDIRHKSTRNIDLKKLAKQTNGFNGADIESVVKESIEKSFIAVLENGKNSEKALITTDCVLEVIEHTHSITESLGDKLEETRKALEKMEFTNASN
ncbi:AAA+-type ATPase, SpoVK/Ycf46/Vps4 family [Pseudobutyrivibrio sp. C4]|uniref:AAA family ATPase n=1 Tax=Pseudobutyrivibrio sp. C4 TaxID=1520803 RepID=UPI0008CDA532|nr:AAA family ATPase [Pseudobutyrivibrio sp. C4]SES90279.1 AAA+-type ATPase, SpoVK/Ycf46/Vps4 family [Pseudobutyrivibrio sp. C4]